MKSYLLETGPTAAYKCPECGKVGLIYIDEYCTCPACGYEEGVNPTLIRANVISMAFETMQKVWNERGCVAV